MPHASFVIAKVPWDRLREALEGRVGKFTAGDPVGADELTEDGIYAGDFGGAAYVYDGEQILSLFSSPDLFANLSRELDTIVGVCSYETVSGTYLLLAADKGKLVRYFSASSAARKPLDLGSALPTEANAPLASVEGLMAALGHLGFDLDGWGSHGSRRALTLPDSLDPLEVEEGPLALRRAATEHEQAHGIPPEQWMQGFQPQVMLGAVPGADGKFEFDLKMVRKPWHQRLRDWFRR